MQLSEAQAEPFAKELLQWLETSYAIAPPAEIDEIVRLFSFFIGHDDVYDCLIGLVLLHRPAEDWALGALLAEITQIESLQEQLGRRLPQAFIERLLGLKEETIALWASLISTPVEEIIADLRSFERVKQGFLLTRDNKTQTAEEQQAPETFVGLTTQLSEGAIDITGNKQTTR